MFGLNELPDLAERIQVALFNVLEERDIQVRGYSLRLPLDVFLVATANPEDYTNRGRIITPLKDRFGAEIRTHYLDRAGRRDRAAAPGGRSWSPRSVTICSRCSPASPAICGSRPRSTSAPACRPGSRIAAAEAVAGSALRRSARTGDPDAVARVCDVDVVLPTLLGKIEFEMGEEGRERALLDHLLRLAIAATFRERLAGLDLSGFTAVFAEGGGGGDRRAGRRPPSC